MWYLLPAALLPLLLASLLWMPLELRADSDSHLLSLRVGVLARAVLEPDVEQLVRLHLRAGFWHFYWRPSDFRKGRAEKPDRKEKKGRRGYRIRADKGLKLLRSFRVRAFFCDLDTGNPVLNARLYPAFALLDHSLGGFRVNFEARNRLKFVVVNRPVRILLAML